MLPTDWQNSYQQILSLQQHDAKLYRKAAWVFFVLSALLLFIFPFGSLIPLILGIYLLYNARKNQNKNYVQILEVEIRKKRCYYYPEIEPEANKPSNTNPTLFLFDVNIIKTQHLNGAGLNDVRVKSIDWLKVNSNIYSLFKPGDTGTFLMSAADDIIGYVWKNEIKLLTGKFKERTLSFTIPQTVVLRDIE
jgi:hypothetical protein